MAHAFGHDAIIPYNELQPLPIETIGVGYPYAPENWPEPGDMWGWRTGRRLNKRGTHYHDRYLYLPERLAVVAIGDFKEELFARTGSYSTKGSNGSRAHIFGSIANLEKYLNKYFPDADWNALYATFHWRIPALPLTLAIENVTPIAAVPLQQIANEPFNTTGSCKASDKKGKRIATKAPSNAGKGGRRKACANKGKNVAKEAGKSIASNNKGKGKKVATDARSKASNKGKKKAFEELDFVAEDAASCRANNKKCKSLMEEAENGSRAMPCDICCDFDEFCRDCSCIVCVDSVSSDHGGCSYIKCQANPGEGVCGHVIHVKCAIKCNLVGTFKDIKLDAEYYCRRCDGRTVIIPHVDHLLQICKAGDMDNKTMKEILELGASMLKDSEKPHAVELLMTINVAISKLERGTNAKDLWNEYDNLVAHPAGQVNYAMEVIANEGPSGVTMYDKLSPSLKLEVDVDDTLVALRRSQELEYRLAEELLQNQKAYLQTLYQQLKNEEDEFARLNPRGSNIPSLAIKERKKQINRESEKFRLMKMAANGFGNIPNDVLRSVFGLGHARVN